MKKMTRMVLISAIFVTSGLTAKIANENYKAVVDNDERIHKAYENAKKPSKAAVLEAIVDATNAEPDERIQNAVIIEPEEPKVVRVKTKVTTSAGVSPISPVMNKKAVNKAEEFIENIAHPAEVVMKKNLDFTPENIPIQELTYETKDIFPEFEEVEEEELVTVYGRYGWNFPWVTIWTPGDQTTTDAKGRRLSTPIDHSAIIANMEEYSDANGLTVTNISYGVYFKTINDGVFTYNYTSWGSENYYDRLCPYLVSPAGVKLRTDAYSGSQLISKARNAWKEGTYVTNISYSGVIDNYETYEVALRGGDMPGEMIDTVTLEGNGSTGYYYTDENCGKALYWYFNGALPDGEG